MEEKLNFKELMEKYKNAKDALDFEDIEKDNKSLLADIKDKNKKIVNVDYSIKQNRNRLNRIKRTMEKDPEFTDNPEALITETEQKLNEAKNYKAQLKKKIKEAEKKLEANKRKLEEPEKVYNEVVAEAETKTNTINNNLKKKISELEEERKNYGVLTKDKEGNPIRRITPEERIVIENITENINKLNKQISINNEKLRKFKALIEQMKGPNKTVSNAEQTNTEPTNGEPVNGEPTNGEPTNGGPVNVEPTKGGPTNGGLTNAEPINGEQTNIQPSKIKKLIEVKVNDGKYEFTYEYNGEISSESKDKIGFFKGLAERWNLLREGKFGYLRTAFKIDPTITQNLSADQMKEYIAFIEQRENAQAPFIVKYDKEKGIMARAFAKSAEKLGLPEHISDRDGGIGERFGDGFDQHDNPPVIQTRAKTTEHANGTPARQTVENEKD